MRSNFRTYAGVFGLALLVRLLYLTHWHDTALFSVLLGDGRQYDEWAREIAGGNWLGDEPFYQAPLYPYFLGVVYRVFGPDLWAVRGLQAVLGSVACVLLALAGRRFFSTQAGIVAGVCLALYPPAIYFDGLVQKGALGGLFMTLLLWTLGEFVADPRRRWLLAAGVTLGAFALVRENALILPPVIVLWLLVAYGERSWRRRWIWVGMLLIGVALILVPVGLRNQALGGGFAPTTSQLGPNLYIGNNPKANGRYVPLRPRRGDPRHERFDATELAEVAEGRPLAPSEVNAYWLGRAVDYVRSDPLDWMALMARKGILVWHATEVIDTDSIEALEDESWLLRGLGWMAHFGTLLPLAVAGLWLTRRDWRRLWLVYGLGASLAGAIVMFYVMARYRYPLVPVLALFAGAGLVTAWTKLRGRAWKEIAVTVAIVLVVAIPSNWPIPPDVDPRTITYFSLGTALVESGQFDAGRAALERSLALDPGFVDAHYAIGDAWLKQGDARRARPRFEQVLREEGDHAHAHTSLGMVLLQTDDLVGAERHFREAIRSEPLMAAAHNNLAAILVRKGRLEEAVTHLEAAVRARPGDADLHTNLAKLLLALGDTDGALRHVQAALSHRPDHVQARRTLARIRER